MADEVTQMVDRLRRGGGRASGRNGGRQSAPYWWLRHYFQRYMTECYFLLTLRYLDAILHSDELWMVFCRKCNLLVL
jgi:hypothetical protein